jgi:hypothetical protein
MQRKKPITKTNFEIYISIYHLHSSARVNETKEELFSRTPPLNSLMFVNYLHEKTSFFWFVLLLEFALCLRCIRETKKNCLSARNDDEGDRDGNGSFV